MDELPEHLQELWDTSKDSLNADEQQAMRSLLIKHKHVFAKYKDDLGRTTTVKHTINTG